MKSEDAVEGYWYPGSPASSVEVLHLLRDYRKAEQGMRARTRAAMGMGESDLLALRYLIRGQQSGRLLRQRELAALLHISNPSASAMVDRLVRDGWAHRLPHPDDRRSVALEPTPGAEAEVRSTLGAMHSRLIDAVDSLDPEELGTVARFLASITTAITQDDHAGEHPASGTSED